MLGKSASEHNFQKWVVFSGYCRVKENPGFFRDFLGFQGLLAPLNKSFKDISLQLLGEAT